MNGFPSFHPFPFFTEPTGCFLWWWKVCVRTRVCAHVCVCVCVCTCPHVCCFSPKPHQSTLAFRPLLPSWLVSVCILDLQFSRQGGVTVQPGGAASLSFWLEVRIECHLGADGGRRAEFDGRRGADGRRAAPALPLAASGCIWTPPRAPGSQTGGLMPDEGPLWFAPPLQLSAWEVGG